MKLGDEYIDILQGGINQLQHLNKFYFANNRITETSADKLIKAVSTQAEELDLSKNHIGLLGIDVKKKKRNF
jgi:Leucine-rich repeat (LRR) protein